MGPRQVHAFLRYAVERLKRDTLDRSYRVYVTDQLQNIPKMMTMARRWYDIAWPESDNRSAEEIAEGVIERMGLEAEDEPS